MSSRRRHYPTAQYQQTQGAMAPGAQPGMQQPMVPGMAPALGQFNPQQQQQFDPVDSAAQAMSNMHLAGQPAVPQQQYQQFQQYQQPQQAAQPAYGGVPVQQPQPVQPMYGGVAPQGQVPVQPAYGGVGAPAAVGSAASPLEYNQQQQQQYYQQQQQALPLNQLYQTDLLRELPPPINDLSLPPPPVILPPNISVIDSNPNSAAPSEYFRSTLNVVPTTNSLLKKSKLPLALVIRPFVTLKDEDHPIAVVEDTIIARCRRCRCYMNPFVVMDDKRWTCNLCNLKNDVPKGFDYDQMNRLSKNRYERNEISYSAVEFIAPAEYTVRPPQPLVYLFVLDVSVNSIKTGLLATVATTILESLDRIPNETNRAKVGFLCVDSTLSYFNIPEDEEEGEPSLLVVPDLEEPFNPSPDSLLVNLTAARKNIEKLLGSLNSIFANNVDPNLALGSALNSGLHLLQSIGGKMIVTCSTLPNIGVGKLQIRNEENFYDKPKESANLLLSNNSFYKTLAVDCNKASVSVDFFLTSASYQDVASLSNLSKYTAGETHYYPSWSASDFEDVNKLTKELSNDLSQDIKLEAVLRVRGSNGLRMNSYYGNFFSRSSDLCSFPSFPRDQSYIVELTIEDNITKPFVYFQTAILHSTINGERRIRVLNLALPTSSNISEIYASADQLAITSYLTQKAVEKIYSSSFNDAREYLNKVLIDILTVFKKEVVAGNVGGSSPLMLSTNLRMLPLLIHSLSKHMGLRSGRVPSDHRANALNLLTTLPLPALIRYIYPTVYSLHDMGDEVGLPSSETGEILLPENKNASSEIFERYGLYLINNSTELFLWVGGDAVPELVNDVFGIQDIFQIPIGKHELPILTNDFSIKVNNIINKIRESKESLTYQNLYIIRGGSVNEPLNGGSNEITSMRMWASSYLVEDRINNSPSYREFLSATKSKINV